MVSNIKKLAKQLWWSVVAGGVISILFGLAAIIWPETTLSVFIYLFSFFVLVISIIVLGQAFNKIKSDRLWWLSTLFAICGISAGLFIIVNPDIARAFIAVLLAAYVFCQSILDLIVASYSDDDEAKTPAIIVGIVGIIFGFLVLYQPVLATGALVWVIGLYILLHGIATEYYAIRLRRSAHRLAKTSRMIIRDMVDDNRSDSDDIPEAEIISQPAKTKTAKKDKPKQSNKR